MQYSERFNPLTKENRGPTDPDLFLDFAKSQVRSIIDSYHGRMDAFAEAIQNGIDAIEKRWSSWNGEISDDLPDSTPRIKIVLDADNNSMEVIDNGTGIDALKLEELLEPFATDKRNSENPQRGHKGVGTTFLAYGHPRFEIHTKTNEMRESVGYLIEGGRTWVTGSGSSNPPDYFRLKESHPALNHLESGTVVKVTFDQTTNLKSVARVIHSRPLMWATVLRSNTAVGFVALETRRDDRPNWAQQMGVAVEIRHVGTEQAEFQFPFPHLLPGNDVTRELQWLQSNPDKNDKKIFELVYVERGYEALRSLLKDEIHELENSDDETEQAILSAFSKYEVGVYASLAYKNTFYEDQFDQLIKTHTDRLTLHPGVGGGVMVASMGMPMGGLQTHLLETMQPQDRRRYFLLVHFNHRYSPDIGRKTIPQEVEPLVQWLELMLLGLLKKAAKHRMLKDKEAETRPTGNTLSKANEELRALIKQVAELSKYEEDLDFSEFILHRAPDWESEVVAIFLDIIGRDRLPGYTIQAIPGSHGRYDALFNYDLKSEEQLSVPEALRVAEYQFDSDSAIHLTDRWMEFKQEITAFIADLERDDGASSKKYFNHVDLLITWSVKGNSSGKYVIEQIDKNNMIERHFVGSTHFLLADNHDHRVEVICLYDLIRALNTSDK